MQDPHDGWSPKQSSLATTIYASLNTKGLTARVTKLSLSGLVIQYITEATEPQEIEEIVLLIDGVSQSIRGDAFEILHDRQIRQTSENGHKLREVGIRLVDVAML